MGDESTVPFRTIDTPSFNVPRKSMWDQAISNEFFCRARQWRDIAEFERKELLKVRVYKSLKLTSRAILCVTLNTIFLSVIDVEFYYSRFGTMVTPRALYPDSHSPAHPAGVYAPCSFNHSNAQPIMMKFSYFTRSLILFLTGNKAAVPWFLTNFVAVCNMWLIWWYTELERRLLVARHHLQEKSSLFLGPLTTNLMIELVSLEQRLAVCLETSNETGKVLNALHVPPFPSPWLWRSWIFTFLAHFYFCSKLYNSRVKAKMKYSSQKQPAEVQLFSFLKLYHIVKERSVITRI